MPLPSSMSGTAASATASRSAASSTPSLLKAHTVLLSACRGRTCGVQLDESPT